MYSPTSDPASIKSEVFYWQLLGLQVFIVYGLIAVAFLTGSLSIRDENFDATVLTVVALLGSNLLYMPQSSLPRFDCCTQRKAKLSNAAYRFSRQWSIRRQGKSRRVCSQLYINIISTGYSALALLCSAAAKSEPGTYGRGRAEVWLSQRGTCFSTFRFGSHTGRGPRFRSRICLGISSPALTCSPGDVALRGIYILTGQAAVRWYVVGFYHVPAVSSFIAQLAIYCFIGGVFDIAEQVCRLGLLIGGEFAVFVSATRGIASKIWKFGGPVPCHLAASIHERIPNPMRVTRVDTIFWGEQHSGIFQKCRGSGFRNLFLAIFILFLLGGFLLEGNPPRGLSAPPLHAGAADPPQRYSERLARNKSKGSTLCRAIDPSPSQSYTNPAPVEVSISDSPVPKSPEAEAVEAEVLDESYVFSMMRSLDGDVDGPNFAVVPVSGSGQHDSQATVDLETTEMHLQFSAPEVDRCSELGKLPTAESPATPVAISDSEVAATVSETPSPRPSSGGRNSPVRAKAKAAKKYKWVPKTVASQGSGGMASAWATLDAVTLSEEWKHRCATIREVPEFFSSQLREAFSIATARIREMHAKKKEAELERAWKLFLLLPRMLLTRTKYQGEDGKAEFFSRFRAFKRGDWMTLVQQARRPKRKKQAQRTGVDPVQAKLRAVEQRARLGEISHARQELVGTPLAPRTMTTYWKLADPTSRPQQPRSLERLQRICQFEPECLLDLDYGRFIANVRSAARGKSGGLSGMRNEHLKCLVFSPRLEDSKSLFYVAEFLARAQIPPAIRKGIALGRMTALDKGSAKVRGIAAGDTFRRVVAKTLAQQFAQEFDQACSPYQFALSTRAGTDCVGHALREISNQFPDHVIASLDGISAYDHADRAQMLEALSALPNASSLLPFVAMFYGHTSEYYWTDEDSEVWPIEQGDGGEQGDPLMPALFALGLHSALVSSDDKLKELNMESGPIDWDGNGSFTPLLFAFLDDLYLVTVRDIARQAFDIVTGEVERIAGIRTNLGKLQLYCKNGGACPQGFEDFQALRAVDAQPIWTGDAPQLEKRGIVVLGSPLGTVEFCKAHAAKRMKVEQELLDWIPRVPNLQVAWLLLYFCAAQRANHLIRLLPPSLSVEYAEQHDRAILKCLESLVQAGPLPENAKRIAVLRCVNGGLGLRSATRTAMAAFWAAWADALPMLHRRVPEHAYKWSEALEYAQANVAHVEFLQQLPSGLQEAELARRQLVAEGFRECPTWEDIREGVLPANSDPKERAPGEWCRGWQFFASRVRDLRFLEFEVRPHMSPTERALLLSQGGPFASQFLQALPTKPQLELENLHLHCLLRRRLRLPLADGIRFCPAHSHGNGKSKTLEKLELDEFGDHLASCMRSGRVQRRANVLEKIWMQVFQEAGGTLVPNEKLRNMRIGVDQEDKRRVEFAVYNLKFGPPLLCDVTQVSPLDQNGKPHPKCAVTAGAAFEVAEKRKANTYREAAQAAGRIVLVTLACEIGGRWSDTCIKWVGMLAKYKAHNEPPHLKRAVEFAWHSRWWSLLSVAAQRAFALSLIEVDSDAIKPLADFEPRVGDILADVRYELGPVFSRLPLRG